MKRLKGFTGLCVNSECRKPIAFRGSILGFGYIDIDCKHCGTENRIDLTLKTVIKMIKTTLVILLLLGAITLFDYISKNPNYAEVPYGR